MRFILLWAFTILCFTAYGIDATIPCTSSPCQNGGTCGNGDDSYICICPASHTGQNCETPIEEDYSVNVCQATTCFNGGTCFTGPNSTFLCFCASGYTGDHCEQVNTTAAAAVPDGPPFPCESDTCANGGTCFTGTVDPSSYFCKCSSGYTGRHCESQMVTNQDFCESRPCSNNGTCFTGPTSFVCVCPEGYTGDLCETMVLCGSSPCQNQGTCFTGSNSYTCVCPSGYYGLHCERVLCHPSLCLNGGTCYQGQTGYICLCTSGFLGDNCETAEVCSDNPCLNDGSCLPTGPGLTDSLCLCREYFYGDHCEHQINICDVSSPCLNGGTCFVASQNLTDFLCVCLPGFKGNQCQIPASCDSNPCQNGAACSQSLDPDNHMYQCQCTIGYVGTHCEIEDTGLGPCGGSDVCLNGGTCVPASPFDPNYHICACPDAFTGSQCELEIPMACDSGPCLNGATCYDEGNGDYRCMCREGYTSRRCEVVGPCVSSPCMNGGVCREDVYNPGNFLCQCQNQFTGTTCTIPPQEDPCSSSPCQNNGVCTPTSEGAGYRCDCRPDFVGQQCDIPDPCRLGPCLNGGTCNAIPVTGGNWEFYCVCQDPFLGSTCAIQRACVSEPCLNNGICMDILPDTASQPVYGTELTSDMLNYRCLCLTNWRGQNCETEVIDPCASNPCHNGGTCFRNNMADQFFCSCPDGYYSPICEADPCASNPCQNNGMCVSVGDDYACICGTGYYGVNCDQEDACRTNPCANGGTCHVWGTSYNCTCAEGFVGTDCSQQDPCSPRPCMNGGTCISVPKGTGETLEYQCLCPIGYGGLICAVNFGVVNKCVLNVCENGGSCFQSADASSGLYICMCSEGFEGEHCDRRSVDGIVTSTERQAGSEDTCDPNPCLNGGSCFRHASGKDYVCVCLGAFTGRHCHAEFHQTTSTSQEGHVGATSNPSGQPCDGNPCLNEGTCMGNQDGTYFCVCPGGFSGTDCGQTVGQESTTPGSGCAFGNRTYPDGATWRDGCGDCSCNAGKFECDSERCKCTWNGQIFSNGESWELGCEFCSCVSGTASCSDMKCRDRCLHESIIYESGTNRTDKCNTCVCMKTVWTCTNNACGKTCEYNNIIYLANEERLDEDNCNTCFCNNGEWQCTTRECSNEPITIKVEFSFMNDFSLILGKEEAFKSALKADLLSLLDVKDKYIQNLMVSEGSIKVNLDLVDDRTESINIENVLVILESAVSLNDYSLSFEGTVFMVNPNSFKSRRENPPIPPDNTLLIIILVAAFGALGLIIVIVSVCWLVKRHRTTRGITRYGEERLPRRSDLPEFDDNSTSHI